METKSQEWGGRNKGWVARCDRGGGGGHSPTGLHHTLLLALHTAAPHSHPTHSPTPHILRNCYLPLVFFPMMKHIGAGLSLCGRATSSCARVLSLPHTHNKVKKSTSHYLFEMLPAFQLSPLTAAHADPSNEDIISTACTFALWQQASGNGQAAVLTCDKLQLYFMQRQQQQHHMVSTAASTAAAVLGSQKSQLLRHPEPSTRVHLNSGEPSNPASLSRMEGEDARSISGGATSSQPARRIRSALQTPQPREETREDVVASLATVFGITADAPVIGAPHGDMGPSHPQRKTRSSLSRERAPHEAVSHCTTNDAPTEMPMQEEEVDDAQHQLQAPSLSRGESTGANGAGSPPFERSDVLSLSPVVAALMDDDAPLQGRPEAVDDVSHVGRGIKRDRSPNGEFSDESNGRVEVAEGGDELAEGGPPCALEQDEPSLNRPLVPSEFPQGLVRSEEVPRRLQDDSEAVVTGRQPGGEQNSAPGDVEQQRVDAEPEARQPPATSSPPLRRRSPVPPPSSANEGRLALPKRGGEPFLNTQRRALRSHKAGILSSSTSSLKTSFAVPQPMATPLRVPPADAEDLQPVAKPPSTKTEAAGTKSQAPSKRKTYQRPA